MIGNTTTAATGTVATTPVESTPVETATGVANTTATSSATTSIPNGTATSSADAAGCTIDIFAGWSADDTATIIAAVLAAVIAVVVASRTYKGQQRLARHDQRMTAYAEALRAVADYLEAPYLIRRRDGTAETRTAITTHISDIQSRITFYDAWLELHAKRAIHDAFKQYVTEARAEAGRQMTAAWGASATGSDADVPLGSGHAHPRAEAARTTLLGHMKADV